VWARTSLFLPRLFLQRTRLFRFFYHTAIKNQQSLFYIWEIPCIHYKKLFNLRHNHYVAGRWKFVVNQRPRRFKFSWCNKRHWLNRSRFLNKRRSLWRICIVTEEPGAHAAQPLSHYSWQKQIVTIATDLDVTWLMTWIWRGSCHGC
jgi:hypothetical protein